MKLFKRANTHKSPPPPIGDCILSLDAGTTSTRAILFTRAGLPVNGCTFQEEHQPHRFNDGSCVEYDPFRLLDAATNVIDKCVSNAPATANIVGIAIANQRETCILWDSVTGVPYHPAIVWQDTRTAKQCELLKHDAANVALFKELSGLIITPYFSVSKIKWMLDNCEKRGDLQVALEAGTALCGTLDSWLVWNFTNKASHVTDTTNACRTGVMNIHTLQWDDQLKELWGIDKRLVFPEKILACNDDFGEMCTTKLKESKTKIRCVIGDQHGALIGNNCVKQGDSKTTYGTGAFLVINTGVKPVKSEKLLTTIAYHDVNADGPVYALEGAIGSCGTAIEWLVKTKRLPARSDAPEKPDVYQITPVACAPGNGSGGIVTVAAFSGLFAPYWCDDATTTTFWENTTSRNGNYVYAVLEGIALQVRAVLEEAKKDLGTPLREHRVDGGVTNSELLLQIQADISGMNVYKPKNLETTALGAALLAGLNAGLYASIDEFESTWKLAKLYEPAAPAEEVERKWTKWNLAVKKVIETAEELRNL